MFSISGLAPALGPEVQLVQSPSFGKDKVFIDDPYADKVSLSSGLQEPALTYQHLAKHNTVSTESGIQNQDKNESLQQPDRLSLIHI